MVPRCNEVHFNLQFTKQQQQKNIYGKKKHTIRKKNEWAIFWFINPHHSMKVCIDVAKRKNKKNRSKVIGCFPPLYFLFLIQVFVLLFCLLLFVYREHKRMHICSISLTCYINIDN